LNSEGEVVATKDIPVGQLLSPKTGIDVSTNAKMDRYMNTLNQTKAGSPAPPILVTPGTKGTPISKVQLEP
jgi:hypothetical protein